MFEFLGALVIFGLMLAVVIMGFMRSEKAVNRSMTARRVRKANGGEISATMR